MIHSGGIVKSSSQRSIVTSRINGQSYVSGTLVRINWDLLNPSEGVFDFSAIEQELEQASLYDSSISLAILDSKTMPQYVLDKCETFDYTFRGQGVTTCLPWDSEYQKYKAELVSAVGSQFDDHPNLAAVYFTYSAMTNGVEMHWRVDEEEFAAAGYTPDKLVDSYLSLIHI